MTKAIPGLKTMVRRLRGLCVWVHLLPPETFRTLVTSVVQGALLAGIDHTIDKKPALSAFLFSLVCFTGLLMLLTDKRQKGVFWTALALALPIALMLSTLPSATFFQGLFLFSTAYILKTFHKVYHQTGRLSFVKDYEALVDAVWDDMALLGVATVFTGVLWGLLATWATLLKSLGLSLISRIVFSSAFWWGVTPTFFALGLLIAMSQFRIAASLRSLIFNLSRFVLPITVLFGGTYLLVWVLRGAPFDTHYSEEMMMLSFMGVFLVNAVHQKPLSGMDRWTVPGMIVVTLCLACVALGTVVSLGKVFEADSFLLLPPLLAYAVAYTVSLWAGLPMLRAANVVLSVAVVFWALLNNNPLIYKGDKGQITQPPPSFEPLHLRWTTRKGQSSPRLGYAHGSPLYLCRVQAPPNTYVGLIRDKTCLYNKSGTLGKSLSFERLLGTNKDISWSYSPRHFPFPAGQVNHEVIQVCRGIEQGRVRIGTIGKKEALCSLVGESRVIQKNTYETLYALK